MPEARSRTTADDVGHPEQIRRPECQACEQAIDVRHSGEQMVNAFAKRVAEDSPAPSVGSAGMGNGLTYAHLRPPFPRWLSSRISSLPGSMTLGPKRM